MNRYAAAAAAAALLALAGCSGDTGEPAGAGSSPGSGAASSGPPILQPGEPGEAASTIGPDEVPSADAANEADVAFVQMMVPHHGQALEMSRMAEDRAGDPAVRGLAERIEAAQGPEIIMLSGWLEGVGAEVPEASEPPTGHEGHEGHAAMAGMLTEEELAELGRTRGTAFDRLFLRSMIRHHRGAIEMAESVQREGSDARAIEIADDVVATQSSEIRAMERLLERIG